VEVEKSPRKKGEMLLWTNVNRLKQVQMLEKHSENLDEDDYM
jgi:hypothetical protein